MAVVPEGVLPEQGVVGWHSLGWPERTWCPGMASLAELRNDASRFMNRQRTAGWEGGAGMSDIEELEPNVHLESAGTGEFLDRGAEEEDSEAEDSEAADGEAEL